MRVELTDEQEFLREAVAGVLERDATPARVREWAESRDTAAADALAERQGWTGIGLDEDAGGQGGGIIELAVMAQELGRTSTPWDRLLGSSLALQLLSRAERDDAAALAAATADGERAAVLCADGRRPSAAWPDSVLTDGRVTLTARYVAGAAAASELVVVAGDRLVVVDAAAAAITPRPLVDRTRSLADVELVDAPVRDLGAIAGDAVAHTAATAAVLVSADALGAAARLLEMTVAYVADRRQFGVAVGSFQAVKHAAAEMLVGVEAARSAVRYASWAVDAADDESIAWASIAKAYACTTAPHVADKALFLHGAIGYTWEHDLQFPFKRTKSDEWLFGSPDAHRDQIADGLALTTERVTALSPS